LTVPIHEIILTAAAHGGSVDAMGHEHTIGAARPAVSQADQRVRWFLGAAVALVAMAPQVAHAHAGRFALSTKKVILKLGTTKGKFVFVGKSEAVRPDPREHPGLVGASLLVQGRGAEGTGRSSLVDLDPLLWKSARRKGTLRYLYRDRDGARGGVRKVILAPGRIVVRGRRLPWHGAEAIDAVTVTFGLGDERHCAEAAGRMRSATGFLARQGAPPEGCPDALCGDGVHELGEECDDGNLDDTDGCMQTCQLGVCTAHQLEGTWDAIRSVFQQRGCTQAICHGSSPGEGGLDLRPETAYAQLFEVPSTGSGLLRIAPGAPRRSSLYLKLAKALDPEGVEIAGAAMPSGLPPLEAGTLEALRSWIYAGAPETGTVDGTQRFLGACLPEPKPVTITPLRPPAAGTGIQFEMPPFELPASSEVEVCFASYYDFTDLVPARFKDPTGQFFYTNGEDLRQDPQSHHLQLLYSRVPEARIHDPAFGAWTCKGGSRDGELCEPLDPGSCDTGLCGSEPTPSVACIGFGPREYAVDIFGSSILGGSQTAQLYVAPQPGFFGKVPIKGVVYWNSHAFNVTNYDHVMHARLNKLFTDDLRFQELGHNNLSTIYLAAGTPPFTERTVCAEWVVPRGARLLWLTSHTHKRGKHFWVDAPDGRRLYESFTYEDPQMPRFDPPIVFDSPSPDARRLEYCARFNNGVAPDGSPDPETVRRHSTTPANGSQCQPIACAAGRIGAPCAGAGDDRTCDSAPGANDGHCDACAMTAGVSTEDTMFLLFGGYVIGDPGE
jgi:cysteine-rich repeat protein